jgi:hypothetical protein
MTGSKFDVGDVLSDSLNLIVKRPVITLPIVVLIMITFTPILLLVMAGVLSESLNLRVETTGGWIGGFIVISLLLFVAILLIAYVLVIGAYPLIVKDAIQGGRIDFRKALDAAAGKFFTIIGAGIVATFLTFLGLIFFIIPGLIIMAWYFYRIPAIVIENRDLIGGLSASEAFAKDKKFKTFLLYILPDIVFNVIFAILPVAEGHVWLIDAVLVVIYLVLFIVFVVWIFIIPSYVYIEYGMKDEENECAMDILG